MKTILNVTDLSSYLYCPRKFYITKIKGMREPPNKAMIEGRIRHEVLEKFSNNEQNLVEILGKSNKNQIINKFQEFLDNLSEIIFQKNSHLIENFSISPEELKQKIKNSMENDISLRAGSIEMAMQKGFIGKQLWENLTPKYISEMPLFSEKLGLKGRADRVLLNLEGGIIIPFELKTRPIEKIWPSDEVQLTAYAMLLEEKYQKPIPLAILEAGNKKQEIQITDESKQKVIKLIKEINKLFNNENQNPKYPSSFSKCQSCNLEQECSLIDNNDKQNN